ncbi:MAG: hypothetical protein KF775_19810, partial [Cyclobacteriaceae bacterium]|nr:hypothetical protein [Cyclobacteriaceae bacterium]
QGNGPGGNFWNTADNIGDGISAFASIPALAGGIAEWEMVRDAAGSASKAYNVAYSESFQAVGKYNKVLGAAGKVLGITGVITSTAVLFTDDFSWTNLTKVGINLGSLALKANPVGLTISLGVGLLDYTGYLDKGLNYIYNENTGR